MCPRQPSRRAGTGTSTAQEQCAQFAEAAPGWVQSGAVIERLNVGGGRRGAKCWLLSVRGHGGFKSRRRANRGCPKHAAAAARKVI
jgi:hypothetical protein